MTLVLVTHLALAWECGTDLSALGPVAEIEAGRRDGELEVRIPVQGYAGQAESDHFTLFWGAGIDLVDTSVDLMLDALEVALVVEMEDLGMPLPVGLSRYKLPVLVADTGLRQLDGAPVHSCGPGCAYYSVDPSGYPWIVVAPEFTLPEFARAGLAHELFHATQAGAETFAGSPGAVWFGEATATWAMGEVFPDHSLHEQYVYPLMARPDLPMEHPNVGDERAVILHPYGEFLFVRHFSERLGDPLVVADTYRSTGGHVDVLDRLDDVLAGRGASLREAVATFAPVAWTLDLDGGAALRSRYEEQCVADGFEPYALPTAVPVDGAPHPVVDLPPGRYGFAVFEVAQSDEGWLDVELVGDSVGSAGTPTVWAGNVLVRSGDGWTVYAMDDRELGVAIDAADAVLVTAMPLADAYVADETFGVAVAAAAGEAPGACACGGSAPTGGWLAASLAVGLRRRRGRHRSVA